MKCWRDLSQTCAEEDCPMWINDETTPGLPVGGLFNIDQGMCVLAANARLEVVQNVLRMAECMEEDLMFEDEWPDEECIPLPKNEKTTPQAGKKRKPKV